MGHMARSALSRMSPVFWLAAAVLVVVLLTHPQWSPGMARALMGVVVLMTGAGIGGVMCGAIEATHTASIEMLIGALLEDRPNPAPRSRFPRPAA